MFAFALTSSQAKTTGCPKASSQPAGSQLLPLAAAAGKVGVVEPMEPAAAACKFACDWSLALHGGLLTTGAGLLAATTPAS